MSFSSGTFSLVAGNPVVTGTTISSTWANNTLSDIATGLTTCVLKDGTQATTASVPFVFGIAVTTAMTTPSTTFALVNTTVTTLNFAGAATTLNVGAAASDTTWTGQSFTLTGANSTDNTVLAVTNTSNAAAASHAYLDISVGGTTSTGDPHTRWTIPSGTSWYAGVDNSDSDLFKIGTGSAVGTNGVLTLAAASVSPSTTDGVSLGTTALMFSDLYLASGAVVNFDNGNYTATHSAGLLTLSNAVTITTGTLTLASTIVSSGTTANVFNTTATTVNFAQGASTALNIGHASGTNTIAGATTFSQSIGGVSAVLTKATAGDVLTLANGGATPYTLYLYSGANIAGISTSAGLTGKGWYADATTVTLFNTATFALSTTGALVSGTFRTTSVNTLDNLSGSGSRTVTADATGILSAASDSKLKTEVDAHLPGLKEVLQLKDAVRAYKWNNDIERRGSQAAVEIGFFANLVAPIIPSAAPMGINNLYGFYDRSVTAALVNATWEIEARLRALELNQ